MRYMPEQHQQITSPSYLMETHTLRNKMAKHSKASYVRMRVHSIAKFTW